MQADRFMPIPITISICSHEQVCNDVVVSDLIGKDFIDKNQTTFVLKHEGDIANGYDKTPGRLET